MTAQLRDVGALFTSRSAEVWRRFVCEVFDELVVDGNQLAAITPNTD